MHGWPRLAVRSSGGLKLACAALALSACGPIQYVSTVTFDAARTVAEAKSARALELAPYEYTGAQEYLHKARELAGYARFQEAVRFGRRAKELALKAKERARERANE